MGEGALLSRAQLLPSRRLPSAAVTRQPVGAAGPASCAPSAPLFLSLQVMQYLNLHI